MLKERNYAVIAIAVALLTGIFYYYLTVMNIYNMSLGVFFEMEGFWFSLFSIISIPIVSVLFGVSIAMLAYNYKCAKNLRRTAGSAGTGAGMGAGAFVATVASGCPTCGAAVLSLIGVPLGLMLLPLRGLELKIASIILLLVSMHFLSKRMVSPKCRIKI